MTLLVKSGTKMYNDVQEGKFIQLTPQEILLETKHLIQGLELENTVVRSNHVSNYAHIKGVLGKDKKSILKQLENALDINDFSMSKMVRDRYAIQTGL